MNERLLSNPNQLARHSAEFIPEEAIRAGGAT